MTFQTMTAEQFKSQPKRGLKYNNQPVEVGGERFDSQKEYRHHMILMRRQGAGEIRNLQHEPPYQVVINGQLICTIKPDHVFEEKTENGWKLRVVDTKSSATITPLFKIKKKMFEATFEIELEIWN